MSGWITAFPKDGEWFHFHNLASIATVSLWVQENYRKTRVKVLTVTGGKMRKWRLTTEDKVKVFCRWLSNNALTDKTKVRVEYKPRHRATL